jgi:hypothetical protein
MPTYYHGRNYEDRTPLLVKRFLKNGAEKGTRDFTLFNCILQLRDAEFKPEDKIFGDVRAKAVAIGLSEATVDAKIKSAYSKPPRDPPQRPAEVLQEALEGATSLKWPTVLQETQNAPETNLPSVVKEGGAALLIRTLFRPGEFIAIEQGEIKENGDLFIDRGGTFKYEQLLEMLEEKPIAQWFNGRDGLFFRINPTKKHGSKIEDVTDFRYSLVEFDHIPKEQQQTIMIASKLPILTIVNSGARSLHFIVHVAAKNAAEHKERETIIHQFLAKAGIDVGCKGAQRWSRLPGVPRNLYEEGTDHKIGEGRQELLEGGINSESTWDQFIAGFSKGAGNFKKPASFTTASEEAAPLPPPFFEEVDLDNYVDQDEEPVPEFPLDTLPPQLRIPVEELVRHYRVKALLPAICALVIHSAALGRGVCCMSNVRKTFANLYALIGADSGTGKSNVFDDLMVPLCELQMEAFKTFGATDRPRAEAELKLLERQISELIKSKNDETDRHQAAINDACRHERLTELMQEKSQLEDKLEGAQRLWCVDFTSEALGLLLAGNNEQMAVLTDEGGTVLYNLLGRYTKGDVTDDILLCKAKTGNGTTVDRVGRAPIVLHHPCVAMLVLTQPDLLYRAFNNERLLIGGFLARCLAADSQLEVQYEDETSLPPVDQEIMAGWKDHIHSLVKTFRSAEEPYEIQVEPVVKILARSYYNENVDLIRGSLSDVASFAARWTEHAWNIALNLHVALYGVDCAAPLSQKTFENAVKICRYFAALQLQVLTRIRFETQQKQRLRLEEILGTGPTTIRKLTRTHGFKRPEVFSNIKNHPDLFGITKARPIHGGRTIITVFLKSKPPKGWKPFPKNEI